MPQVVEYRKKLDSIADGELVELKELNAKLAEQAAKRVDPRRESSGDPRQEDEVPVDVVHLPPKRTLKLKEEEDAKVEVEPDPFPSSTPPPAPEKKR